jgi:hypothetical protein
MKILFLDFDGVLHPLGLALEPGRTIRGKPVARAVTTRYFQWNELLAQLLAQAGARDLRIVVHSTWRTSRTSEQLAQLLGPLAPWYGGSVSATLDKNDAIAQWLAQAEQPVDYRILDDTASSFRDTDQVARLVRCHSLTGVTEPTVQKTLQEWLKA